MKIIKKLKITSLAILMGGLWLSGCSSASSQPSQPALQKALQDELVGFNKIEKDINKGDFNSAGQVYEGIHTEFHAMILDQIKAKLGNDYGDKVHGKIGILAESIMVEEKDEVKQAIQLNRDSIHTVAKDMGISLDQ